MPHLLPFDHDQILGLGISATILLGAVALLMLVCRQPLHRLFVARTGLLCVLLLPFVVQFDLFPGLAIRRSIRVAWDLVLEWLISGEEPYAPSLPILIVRAAVRGLGTLATGIAWEGVATLYLLGVGLGAIRLFLGLIGGRFIVSTSRSASVELQNFYERLPFRPRRRPRLCVSSRIGRPMLVGVIRPRIVLPESIIQRNTSELLGSTLVHELAHAEALDPTFTFLIELIQVFAFPILPSWWIRSQIRLDQEFLADARTVERLGDRVGYASSLISLSAKSSMSPIRFVPLRASLNRNGSKLYRRILMLLRAPFEVETTNPKLWTMLIVGAILVIPALSIVLGDNKAVPVFPHPMKRVEGSGRQSIPNLSLAPNLVEPARVGIPCPKLERFVLEGKIYIDPASLDRVQIAGLHLGLPDQPVRFISPWSYLPRWQSFRIEVDRSETRLRVGGESWTLRRRNDPISTLSFLSTSKLPVFFSKLTLRWDRSGVNSAAGTPLLSSL